MGRLMHSYRRQNRLILQSSSSRPMTLSKAEGLAHQQLGDNILFELGLLMGAIGPHRTFIIADRTANLRLPSDLAGITYATYSPPQSRAPGSLRAALAAASVQIEEAIVAAGLRVKAPDIKTYEDTIRRLQGQLCICREPPHCRC